MRDPDGAAAYRDGLVKTIEEADELIKTFNSLLLIARLEGGAVAESMASVDPAAIVGDVAELYEPVAEEAGLALEISAPTGLSLVANRELVSQAVANLVDNAIKYSASWPAAPTQPVDQSRLRAVGETIEIAVADRGPGVAPEDRERALQRFVRLEKSRSQPGSGPGPEPRRRGRAPARRLRPPGGQCAGPAGDPRAAPQRTGRHARAECHPTGAY